MPQVSSVLSITETKYRWNIKNQDTKTELSQWSVVNGSCRIRASKHDLYQIKFGSKGIFIVRSCRSSVSGCLIRKAQDVLTVHIATNVNVLQN